MFDKTPTSETSSSRKLWTYDLRTDFHLTLEPDTLKRERPDKLAALYSPMRRHKGSATWAAAVPAAHCGVYDVYELRARHMARPEN